jgi:nucleoside-diphosphate-sugar epimerase
MMKFIASLSEFKSWMFGGEPIVRRGWIDELTKNFAYDITKARKDLGYSPEFSTKEGVTRTIDWYRKNSLLK